MATNWIEKILEWHLKAVADKHNVETRNKLKTTCNLMDEQSVNGFVNGRKKKFTGGNASKRHRDRVNVEFNNLAQLLPFAESVIAKLDKSSILRLAVSYIRAKSFFKGASIKTLQRETLSPLIKEGTGAITKLFSKALDGFLLVLTEDMKVLFVTESVRDYLGYCQAGIIHESFLQFVNPSDYSVVQDNVNFRSTEIESSSNTQDTHKKENAKRTPVARQFVCRMKCAFSCSSRFYTAYRAFQFSGHLRKSTIQEGRLERTLNTLVVFATPLNNNNNNNNNSSDSCESGDVSTSSVGNTSSFDSRETLLDSEHSDGCGEITKKEMSFIGRSATTSPSSCTGGFRIEPTLRPHVAPIPVTSKEQSEMQHINHNNNENNSLNDTKNNINNLSTSSTATSTKKTLREPPFLLSVSEMKRESQSLPPQTPHATQLTSLPLPTLIKRERYSPPVFMPKSHVYPASVDSIYSDHSDDSKASPVSSPNLQWRESNRKQLLPPLHPRAGRTPPLVSAEADLLSSIYQRNPHYRTTTISSPSPVVRSRNDYDVSDYPWAGSSSSKARYSPPFTTQYHPRSHSSQSGFLSDSHRLHQREYAIRESLLDLQRRRSDYLHAASSSYGSSIPNGFYEKREIRGTTTATTPIPPVSRNRFVPVAVRDPLYPHVPANNKRKMTLFNPDDEELLRKKSKFNISSLLGLEDKSMVIPENTHRPLTSPRKYERT